MFLTLLSTQGATLGYQMLPLRGVERIIRDIRFIRGRKIGKKLE